MIIPRLGIQGWGWNWLQKVSITIQNREVKQGRDSSFQVPSSLVLLTFEWRTWNKVV
jgi:hypothetical protein